MPVTASTTRAMDVPAGDVWAVLDDFQNIDGWTDSVKTAQQKSANETGLGAQRVCELAPMGEIFEEIVEYRDGEKIRIAISDIKKLPLKSSDSTFTVRSTGDGTSEVTFTAIVEPKGGIFSGLIGKRMEKGLPKQQAGMLEELEAAAKARSN